MTTPRVALLAGAALCAVLLAMGLAPTVTQGNSAQLVEEPDRQTRSDLWIASELELSGEQRRQIKRLRAAEEPRIERLRDAVSQVEAELGRAEMAQPFEAARVSELIAHRAEASAYLRGTESRVVAAILEVLTLSQQERFAALRSAHDSERARVCEI